MSLYLQSIALPPPVLSEQEQAALLTTSGERRGAFRDHMLFALALGTGLREHEIVALNVSDVQAGDDSIARRIQLKVFKRSAKRSAVQEAVLSQALRLKLAKFLKWKVAHHESTAPDAPLFVSRRGRRLSPRQVRHLFAVWQERAGFERHFGFHALRHTACTALYRRTKDLRLVQRFARHSSIVSTMRYSHPSEAELLHALEQQPC